MSMVDQTVLFYPFAAFTGHDGIIAEAARLTDERPIPDESVKQEISNLLQLAATDSNLVLNLSIVLHAIVRKRINASKRTQKVTLRLE